MEGKLEYLTQEGLDELIHNKVSHTLEIKDKDLSLIELPNRFTFVKYTNCKLDTSIKNKDLSFSEFINCDLSNTEFNTVNLVGSVFQETNLSNTQFKLVSLGGSRYKGNVFKNTVLNLTDISNGVFEDNKIISLDIRELKASEVVGIEIITIENAYLLGGRITYIPILDRVYLPYTSYRLEELRDKELLESGEYLTTKIIKESIPDIYTYFKSIHTRLNK